MQRYLFPVFVLMSSLILAGCTTPEKRQEKAVKDNLTFYSDQKTPEKKEVAPTTPQSNPVTQKKMYTQTPAMAIDVAKKYTATLRTSAGDIVVDLTAKETPITVNNFVFLAREKFYDGTIFHRTIPNFMIQGGDPTGTGTGGPGYKFQDEPFTGQYTRGVVAMANAGPNTNGSQFFIMHGDMALQPDYVIFGKVISGMEVVDKIAGAPTRPGGEESTPVTPVTITSIEIGEK